MLVWLKVIDAILDAKRDTQVRVASTVVRHWKLVSGQMREDRVARERAEQVASLLVESGAPEAERRTRRRPSLFPKPGKHMPVQVAGVIGSLVAWNKRLPWNRGEASRRETRRETRRAKSRASTSRAARDGPVWTTGPGPSSEGAEGGPVAQNVAVPPARESEGPDSPEDSARVSAVVVSRTAG